METKFCTKCKTKKDISEYCKDKRMKDGISFYCKSCTKVYSDKTAKRIKVQRLSLRYTPEAGYKQCFTCKKDKIFSDFNVLTKKKDGLTPSCRLCINSRKVYKKVTEYPVHIDEYLLSIEQWKDLSLDGETFPYRISDCGRLYSLRANRILKYAFDEDGYIQSTIYGNGKRITRKTHIFVGLHFIENDDPENKKEINHINGDKSNIYAYNLEWSTRKQNLDHRDKTGLACVYNSSNHPRRKKVINTANGEIFESAKLAAENSGIKHLYQLLNGRVKNHTTYKYL